MRPARGSQSFSLLADPWFTSGRAISLHDAFAIPADSFARTVVFAMSQPDEVDVNEILFRAHAPGTLSHNPFAIDMASLKSGS